MSKNAFLNPDYHVIIIFYCTLYILVPFELMANIIEIEVEGFVNNLTSRHIRTLAQYLDIDKSEETLNEITEANNDTIFNTVAMITDWIGQEECSNYEKRWRIKEALGRIGRHDLTGKKREFDIVL